MQLCGKINHKIYTLHRINNLRTNRVNFTVHSPTEGRKILSFEKSLVNSINLSDKSPAAQLFRNRVEKTNE